MRWPEVDIRVVRPIGDRVSVPARDDQQAATATIPGQHVGGHRPGGPVGLADCWIVGTDAEVVHDRSTTRKGLGDTDRLDGPLRPHNPAFGVAASVCRGFEQSHGHEPGVAMKEAARNPISEGRVCSHSGHLGSVAVNIGRARHTRHDAVCTKKDGADVRVRGIDATVMDRDDDCVLGWRVDVGEFPGLVLCLSKNDREDRRRQVHFGCIGKKDRQGLQRGPARQHDVNVSLRSPEDRERVDAVDGQRSKLSNRHIDRPMVLGTQSHTSTGPDLHPEPFLVCDVVGDLAEAQVRNGCHRNLVNASDGVLEARIAFRGVVFGIRDRLGPQARQVVGDAEGDPTFVTDEQIVARSRGHQLASHQRVAESRTHGRDESR